MQDLILTLTNIAETLQMPAYIFCVIMGIVGGFQIALGGQEGREKGKKTLTNAVVGFIVVMLAFSLADTLQDALVF